MVKHQLRLSLQKTLLAMSSEQRREKSIKACRNLIGTPQFQEASTIMMFLSLPHEVCTNEAILCAWQLGKMIAVPKISWQQRHILPVQINTLEDDFSTGIAGLRNPVKGAPVPFEKIDLVVTPGLAFDRQGNRLGRGGGYYDRFFTNKKLKTQRCGFAFSEQLIDLVPVSERDEKVDLLVTDEQVIYFDTGR